MIQVHLHGALRKYGKTFDLDVANVVQCCQLLSAQIKGFREDIKKGYYRIVIGNKKDGMVLSPDEVYFTISKEVHIIPVVSGSGRGLGQLIAGIALVAISFTPIGAAMNTALWSGASTAMANIGVAMALGGAALMLAPQLGADYNKRQATSASFIFNGTVNTTGQGMPVPLVYGRHMVGSAVISSAINIGEAPIFH